MHACSLAVPAGPWHGDVFAFQRLIESKARWRTWSKTSCCSRSSTYSLDTASRADLSVWAADHGDDAHRRLCRL